MAGLLDPAWPASDDELIELQCQLAWRAATEPDWTLPQAGALAGGCFVAFGRGAAGPGRVGDHGWAAAVVWPTADPGWRRRADQHLKGVHADEGPRRADDVVAQAVVAGKAGARYVPGLLARREGPLLAAAVDALGVPPDVLLVDATGIDHPRRAGLALHLGAACAIATVGVTRRTLVAGQPPDPAPSTRGDAVAFEVDGRCAGFWVCTKTGAQPLAAHAGWRTTAETALRTVLAASTPAARTPVPLQEARRVAREARALAG